MTIARDFVDWADTVSIADIPSAIRHRTALHVLDALGTGLAAARMDNAPFAEPVARALGAGEESTLIGSTRRSPAGGAALANGILIHSLDFDDTHTAGLVHATAMTLPAALAVAEREGRSGADLLRAMVLGYELAGRLSRAVPHGFHARGFHATSVCGTLTSALVTALLSNLSTDVIVNALGIAGSQSSGSMEFLATGAATKQIHPGWASLAGVVAAGLAAGGATGPDTSIEGEHGLFALYSAVAPDLASVMASLPNAGGATAAWQVDGVAMKPYPACHLMHRILDVGRQLHGEVDVDDVSDVLVRIPADSVPIVASPQDVKRRPRSPYEAKFSVQWSLAAMLIDGEIGVDTYRSDRISRPDVEQLSARVRYEELHGDVPAAEEPGDVTLVLSDGTERRLRTDDDAFSVADGELDDLILDKFALNAGASRGSSDRVVAAVLGLDRASDLKELALALDGIVADWGRGA
jgi:2-methylcitrate dehydratase PrpD